MSILSPDNRFHFLLLLLAGALATLGFQPFGVWPVVLLSFGLLLHSWQHATARQSFINGWWFGVGLQCAGVCWIFWSMHYHGGAPVIMAFITIFLLASYLSIYTALAGYAVNRFCSASAVIRLTVLFPLSWGLFEWVQGYVMTGFAWMQPGYALIDTPLSGYAPVFGNHAVGVVMMMCLGVVLASNAKQLAKIRSVALVAVLLLIGLVLKNIAWTQPLGEPITVSLVQGNIPQHLKWKREMHQPTLHRYRELTLQSDPVDLVIWPETAVPGYRYKLRGYLDELNRSMQARDSDLLLGIFIKDQHSRRYFNSVYNVDGQIYHKRHLVPLGEFVPLRSLIEFFNSWMDIPMSDIAHGSDNQPLMQAAGITLGVNICFEDAFARDIRKDLPEANVLVNVSNDAWFDGSHETLQHHTMARMRALESGRYMVRATNTGFSSIINAQGNVVAAAPVQKIHVLTDKVQPMQGATPYVRWGDGLIVLLAIAVLLFNRKAAY